MARIRTVKPELPQDAKLARVSRDTRYHFVLLLTVSDDEGFFRANPRSLLGQLYPHDADVSETIVERMNHALERIGVLEFVQTPDGPIGRIANWKKHQKIDRPSRSHLGQMAHFYASDSREAREDGASVQRTESLVLSPESLPDVVDEGIAFAEAQGAINLRDPDLTALFLAICANKAVTERWGEQINVYAQGHAAALLADLRTAGVPAEVARLSLYRQCRESSLSVPPKSINYFRPGILADWDAEQTRTATAGSTESAPPREAGASDSRSRGGARRENKPSSIPDSGRATLLLGKIKALVVATEIPGQGIVRRIPKASVAALGDDVLAAYESIGGADRIISATGKEMSFVIRDFDGALRAAAQEAVHV